LPALGRAKAAAKTVKCMSNLRQIGIGNALHVADFDAYPRGLWFTPDSDPAGFWADQLKPYMHNSWTNDLYRCPGNPLKTSNYAIDTMRMLARFGLDGLPIESDYDINDRGAKFPGANRTDFGIGCVLGSDGVPHRQVRESEVLSPGGPHRLVRLVRVSSENRFAPPYGSRYCHRAPDPFTLRAPFWQPCSGTADRRGVLLAPG
jgi:hypothetical protein